MKNGVLRVSRGNRSRNFQTILAGLFCVVLCWQFATAASFSGRVIEWDFYSGVPSMHTNLPPGLNDVVAVAASGINGNHEFSLALKSDGTIQGTGFEASVEDTTGAGRAARFYRLKQ